MGMTGCIFRLDEIRFVKVARVILMISLGRLARTWSIQTLSTADTRRLSISGYHISDLAETNDQH